MTYSGLVRVHLPIEVARSGFVNDWRHAGEVRGNVVFESIFADVAQQLLQCWDLHNPSAAKSFERIIGEAAAAGVAADCSLRIIG